eukprot:221787-Hanusia_phi.AAC.1
MTCIPLELTPVSITRRYRNVMFNFKIEESLPQDPGVVRTRGGHGRERWESDVQDGWRGVGRRKEEEEMWVE